MAAAQVSSSDPLPIQIDGTLCHPTQLMVKLNDTTIADQVSKAGARLVKVFPEIDWAVVECDPGALRLSKDRLSSLPFVERVELNRAARPAYVPNDPMWTDMWHARAIKADKAWDISKGNSSVIVAVIDTGVNVVHEDLIGSRWRNPGEIAEDHIDNDGNGYIDDLFGWDFAYNDRNPNDVHGHGTACAGLVAAVQDNNKGGCGVAPKAKWMALKAATDAGWFYDSANIGAYLYAANNGAKVLSCSFFSDRVSPAEHDAINYCWNHNILPVVAAGNANTIFPYYPGAYDNVLGVGATTTGNARAGFSNMGSWVDVAAPGTGLQATTTSLGYTTGFGGTSGATPQVAGLAALVYSAKPGATNAEVRAIIEDTATDLTTQWTNYGMVNCEAALKSITQPVAPKSPVVRWVSPIVSKTGGIVRVYGRGFEAPHHVYVTTSGVSRAIVNRGRNFMDVSIPAGNGRMEVWVDGYPRAVFNRPSGVNNIYGMIEASCNNGGSVTGGFFDSLDYDSKVMTVTAGTGGEFRFDGTFMKVQPTGSSMTMKFTRAMPNIPLGLTETVYLYNWSTASFPYGVWDAVYTGTASRSAKTSNIAVNNIANYVDPEGTMYFRVEVPGATTAGPLQVHTMQIRD